MAIFVGVVGLHFRARVKHQNGALFDLTGADDLYFRFRLPSQNNRAQDRVQRPAVLVDGWMEYVTVDGDITKAGSWSVQGYVHKDGNRWPTSVHTFLVEQG